MDRAHELGLRVTAHVNGLEQLDKAMETGVDELAHMLMTRDRIPDPAIEVMAERLVVVPTLSIREGTELDVAVDNLARFRAAGGRIVYGTDLGNEGPQPGIDEHEVSAMARAGMGPLEILRSATVDAARILGLPDKGVLRGGADADIVAIGGDVMDDPSALTEVRRVSGASGSRSARES